MTPQFCQSPDGTRIAYNITGSGPVLMLLHGLGKTRLHWHKSGYVDRLQQDFTVITVDLRGSGESDHFFNNTDYAIEKICDDLYAVADAGNVSQFAIWGYSWGGSIARYLGAQSNRVTAVAMVGAPFGPAVDEVFDRYIDEFEQKYGHLAETYQQGILTEKSRLSALKGQIPELLACFKAMRRWSALEPDQMRCPTLLVVGSKNENAMRWLNTHRQMPEGVNLQIEVIQGLNHAQEFSQVEKVFPLIRTFLKQTATK